jgi:hypothetical protein
MMSVLLLAQNKIARKQRIRKDLIEVKEKDLNISEVRQAQKNISDLKVYGDGDTFALLCKASSQEQGWMKSTKVCNLDNGCIVQVTTQQRNPDGSYAVAEALTFVPGVNMDKSTEPRRLRCFEEIYLEKINKAIDKKIGEKSNE